MSRIAIVLGLIFGLAAAPAVWAGEHGGKEHGGTSEHGGSATAVAPASSQATGDAAVLKEAATALRTGQARPDLADKLEKIAQKL